MTPPDRAPEPLSAEAQRYETNVRDTLDHRLPPHTPECDEAWTSGKCLRCDVMAGISVAFGFARSLDAARDSRPVGEGLREAAENVSDRRTLMDDGFWVSRKEMRALDLALGRADIGTAPVDDGLAAKAAVMTGWAAPPDLHPAGRWLSLSVALAILRGTHPALATDQPASTEAATDGR